MTVSLSLLRTVTLCSVACSQYAVLSYRSPSLSYVVFLFVTDCHPLYPRSPLVFDFVSRQGPQASDDQVYHRSIAEEGCQETFLLGESRIKRLC